MSYQPDDIVANYQIIAPIGAGGMGAIYKIRNLITDRVEAMKVLLPNLQSAPDLAERFNREIKLHASLVHPNIASLHTAIRVDNQLLMIMELVEGISLAERLQQGPMSLRESIVYISEVLSALSYAHSRGVVHRDIKPANIMITPDRRVKLMDFGIAIDAQSSARKLTMAGMALGSLLYMSPEQVKSAPVDPRSDLYSVGITLYRMVTGECPIQGDSEYSIMSAHLNTVPQSPSRFNPSLPVLLSAVILRSIEKLPEHRFQTADQFKMELQSILSQGAEQAVPPPTVTFHPAGAQRSFIPVETSSGALDPERLMLATKELALYVGPMAKILVTRAAKKSRNMQEVYQAVATEIPSPSDREKFLAKLR